MADTGGTWGVPSLSPEYSDGGTTGIPDIPVEHGGTIGTKTPTNQYGTSFAELPVEAKNIISIVWERLSDSMDNEERGVWLNEASGFNKDRMAMLLTLAIGRVNSRMLQIQNYSVDIFPYAYTAGTAAVVSALMVECIKHLIISYTEQPDVSSVGAPHASRTHYASEWKGILTIVEAEFKEHVAALNRQVMFSSGLGGGMIALVGNSNRAMDVARYGRPVPRTWLGF